MKKITETELFLCNQESSLGEIIKLECEKTKLLSKHLPPSFDQKFEIVSGINCPNGAVVCGQENCHEFELPELIKLQKQEILKIIASQSQKEYTTGRGLDGRDSYNAELNIVDGGIQSLFEEYAKKHNHKIEILDNGCGSGFAHTKLKKLTTVKKIYGITLPIEGEIYGDNIIFANALNLTGRNFDVTMSVHGFSCYNPYGEIYDGLPSAIRLINSTKIGGLYFDSEGNPSVSSNKKYGEMLNLLIQKSIIKYSESAQNFARLDEKEPPIFEVIQHLTIEKIRAIIDALS